MRRLTFRDALATLFVAAIVVPYIGYLVNGSMPFIQDSRGMAGVGLVGLVLCFIAWGTGIRSAFGRIMAAAGVVSLGLGIAAMLMGAEGSAILLGVFVASIVVVWAAETLTHAGVLHRAA
jgi:hypothetical protein